MTLEIKLASAIDEFIEYFHLRWLVYGHESVGLIDKERMTSELEMDQFDIVSDVLIAKDGDTVIAGMRYTPPNDEYGIPLARYLNFNNMGYDSSNLYELGRRVARDHMNPKSRKMQFGNLGILALSYEYATAKNVGPVVIGFQENDDSLARKLCYKILPMVFPYGGLEGKNQNNPNIKIGFTSATAVAEGILANRALVNRFTEINPDVSAKRPTEDLRELYSMHQRGEKIYQFR